MLINICVILGVVKCGGYTFPPHLTTPRMTQKVRDVVYYTTFLLAINPRCILLLL